MNSIMEINNAGRPELIRYLESWGFATYDHESTEQLRAAAVENFQTEGAGAGPMVTQ